ncbi:MULTISPECIES: TonB-dependent siderophore receptor [Halomonadaceae]|jgi:iron complex outermembrane recepter protein|uniref:TonB-dependent siderophore receptor n=1 Tax=Halomonadaceae TaxID=28256 RepID=UPI0012EF6280|nr:MULTISPECIES: TonB-dependent siderophore receptor [Halomonas]CAD5275129.1 Ferrichrome-iron receptor [Halomonas sp. 156]CAD5276779.1 Ferrichrome-iron receptor [Halomonas sp. 113]CAD5278280.1 Ferrichrome-iron receptor [Halomonas sp. 59]CAD5283900.1 Ferrichrome-iron receptor [Halomonas sp. I3]VXC04687.1 Ferrichrome-iron receptor [Halomonas titanicae]
MSKPFNPKQTLISLRYHHGKPSCALGGIALGCALMSSMSLLPLQAAQAQTADGQAQQAASQQAYSIEPGSLGSVLSKFASHAGIVLSFPADLTDDLQSAGLNGRYSVEEGFAQLLQGSGLRVVKRGAADYVMEKAGTAENMVLDTVAVVGSRISSDGYLAYSTSAGSKTDTPLIELAQSISVVTEEQLRDRQPSSVEQAVAYTAGVRVEAAGMDPRFDLISVRGYPTVYHGDFLDGLRQPNSGWLSYYSTVPYNLERIEIVKGPDSMRYGQLSPGGLVNRVSKRPSADAPQEVQLQVGSHDHLQGQFDVGGDMGSDVQYRLVGVMRDAQTDIEQVDNDVSLLAPSLYWQISDRTDITFITQYQERQTSASPRPYQDGDNLTHFWSSDEDFDKLDQEQWALGYEFNHHWSDQLQLQQNVRYGQVDTTNQYLSAGTLSGTTLSRSSVGLYEEMESLSTDTRLMATFDQGGVEHEVMLGADYAYLENDVIYAGGSAPSIDIDNPDYSQPVAQPSNVWTNDSGKAHRRGLYLQDQVKLDNWRLTAGIRRDWARDETRNHLTGTASESRDEKNTWRFGALYAFDSGLSPYFSYAQSFLPESGTDVSGNDFDPTEGEQFELGLKYQPAGSDAMLTAAIYQIDEANRKTTDLENPLFQVQTGEVRTRGLELEAVGNVTDDLRMTASYNYNRSEITADNDGNEGSDLANTPRHLASLWLDYRVPALERLRLSGGVRYIGSEYIDNANSNKNAAYSLFDMAAHYDFAGSLQGVRASLNATNVTDEEHISCEGIYCYRGAGRSLIGSIAYQW